MVRTFRGTIAAAGMFLVTGPGFGQEATRVAESPPASLGEPRDRRTAFETLTAEPFAEKRDEMETDRDAFTPASSVVGRGRTVVESAYSYLENRRSYETHSLPELLLRYGLSERLELRLGFNYEVGGGSNEISGSGSSFHESSSEGRRLERETKISYGVKVQLTEQDAWLPRSALILQGTTPTGGSEGTPTATQLIATGVAGWELPNRWRFDTALRFGTASQAGERYQRWAPSAVLRVPFGERVTAHAEYFGIFSSSREISPDQHYFSSGAHYLLSDDFELGTRVGWGLNDQSVRFFTNVGIGVRF